MKLQSQFKAHACVFRRCDYCSVSAYVAVTRELCGLYDDVAFIKAEAAHLPTLLVGAMQSSS